MIKNNIIIIVLIFIMIIYCAVMPYMKLSLRFELDISENQAVDIFMRCPLIAESTLEYQDNKTTIMGGNLALLPDKGNINIQAAVRECGDKCSVVIGYPALPLESY